eukprot:1227835-Pleurochrysis_carterae.AAC.1
MALAGRAEEMGLAGPLGARPPDRWRDGAPMAAAAACMAALRASFQARLLEATDACRTETALNWFAAFAAATKCLPFVDPDDEGGVEYNTK